MSEIELKAALLEHGNGIKAKQAEMEKAFGDQKAELKAEIEALRKNAAIAQDQLDNIATAQAKAEKSGVKSESLSLPDAIKSMLNSPEFKEAKAKGFRDSKPFEIKADTSNITGAVNLTNQKLKVSFAPDRAQAFLPTLNPMFIGADKNRVLWVDGAYTSNVGYVGEGTGQANADTGTAVEKSRGMSKISAKLPLTAELLEDAEYIASAFRVKMQDRALLFADKEFYSGNGSDALNPTHIYGIVGHATAFSEVVAGVAASVKLANIGDLIDAAVLQAGLSEQRGLNVVWMNPADFYKFKKTKASDGQYIFVKDVNGNYTVNGLNVILSSAVTADTMTIADTSKIQAWWKRNPEIKFSQMNGTDFVDDAYTAVMFLRCQCVVETLDKTAIIQVASIAASVTAITAV